MAYETKMTKGYYGHKAETVVSLGVVTYHELGEAANGTRELSLTTSKDDRGQIVSRASVAIIKPTDRGYSMKVMALGSDYFKTLQRLDAKPVTEKKVREAHDVALQQFEAVIEAAKAFYAAKEQVA